MPLAGLTGGGVECIEEVREVVPRRLEEFEARQKRREGFGEEQLLRESMTLVDLALRRARASVAADRELKDLVCEALKQRLAGL